MLLSKAVFQRVSRLASQVGAASITWASAKERLAHSQLLLLAFLWRIKPEHVTNARDITIQRDCAMLQYGSLATHLSAADQLSTVECNFIMRGHFKADGSCLQVMVAGSLLFGAHRQTQMPQCMKNSAADLQITANDSARAASG